MKLNFRNTNVVFEQFDSFVMALFAIFYDIEEIKLMPSRGVLAKHNVLSRNLCEA